MNAPIPAVERPGNPSPKRIQLSRKKGFRLREISANAVKVDRSTVWGNRWGVVKADGRWAVVTHRESTRYFDTKPEAIAYAVERHARFLAEHPDEVELARPWLAGHDIACWCAEGSPCHGDNWLAALNPGWTKPGIPTDPTRPGGSDA